MMLPWNSPLSSWCSHESSSKTCVIPSEIMRAVLQPVKMHHDSKRTFVATFQENPGARMQKLYQSKDRGASLSSRLFRRILVREYRKCLRAMVVQEPCHRHFSRESLCENNNCKNERNEMSTFTHESNNKRNTVWEPVVLLAPKWYFFQNV